jgi:hypothetical protein
MPTESKSVVAEPPPPEATLADFLESHPPGQVIQITDLAIKVRNADAWNLTLPELQLHCGRERCNGIRVFRCTESYGPRLSDEGFRYEFVTYKCSNCQDETKTFSLAIRKDYNAPSGLCYKFGELPVFGPTTPARLIKLIGTDRDIFLRGRRCENQGLGIGAFVYYRRVVENQKNRILEEIKKVMQKVGSKPELISLLDQAIAETQFHKAMQIAKDGMPESLLIDSHNPLGLLHSALSEGVHELTDEECLDLAGSIRVVLTELSERLSQALKDEAELTKAVSKLLNRKK